MEDSMKDLRCSLGLHKIEEKIEILNIKRDKWNQGDFITQRIERKCVRCGKEIKS